MTELGTDLLADKHTTERNVALLITFQGRRWTLAVEQRIETLKLQ